LSRADENPVDVDALVVRINSLHGAAFARQGRTKIGESGAAYFLNDAAGAQFVLKFGYGTETRTERVQQMTKRLRDLGCPAPLYVCVGDDAGVKYSVQAMMPGKPARRMTASTVDQLIAINRLQAGLGGDLPPEWPSRVIDGVLKGFQRYCVIDTLRRESATRAMLETLQALVVRNAGEISVTGDIVHWDFNPGNVLGDGNRITGVIDWEGACAGDRGFDLATFLFYSYDDREMRDPLWREVLDRSGHGELAVYMAHMIVRQVDWSMRHHGPESTGHWMRVAGEIVLDLSNQRGA
jgi:aminoglycoside phosphotransferase